MTAHLGKVLDDSKVRRASSHSYAGAVIEHCRLDGARVARIMHPPHQRIAPHEHDWPVLTLYRIGGYREVGESGEVEFDGPSVVFQPAGAAHADEIGAAGLETLAMTFDPDWLGPEARAALPERTCWRPGGAVAAASRKLAEVWLRGETSAREMSAATSRFLLAVFAEAETLRRPAWADEAEAWLEREQRTGAIAENLARHPAWLARAYRAWRGEGLMETLRRRRVERATLLLRERADGLADVAAACGFCDQSHMNRVFRAVLGRTPLEVRREAALVAPLA